MTNMPNTPKSQQSNKGPAGNNTPTMKQGQSDVDVQNDNAQKQHNEERDDTGRYQNERSDLGNNKN